MRRFLFGLLGLVGGYVGGAILGYLLIQGFSSNQHDRSVEAAMTGAFAVGPLFALIGLIVGIVVSSRKKKSN